MLCTISSACDGAAIGCVWYVLYDAQITAELVIYHCMLVLRTLPQRVLFLAVIM